MIGSRQKKIREALPDALDLLVVCVEAGQGLDAAIKRVAEDLQESSPIISQELLLVNLEIMAGLERQQALKNLGERTGVEELVSLCNILIQSDRFGTSIAQALKTQSDYIRTARRQRLEAMAAKTPVKLLFPMLLFIFPAIMVVILGPAIITLVRILQQGRVNRAAHRPDGGGFRWDPDRPPPFLPYIFNSSRVLATAAADFCSIASSSWLSFKVRIFSIPPAPKITGTPK